jgi:predicted alpha/beta-hydrolase family hydrolase
MYSMETLPVQGYRKLRVNNTFFKQDTDTDQLTVILPGYAYTAEMPLLYYPTMHSLSLGSDVLWMQYAYNELPAYQNASDSEKIDWLYADVEAVYRAALEKRSYERLTLIGKSIGTRAMIHLLSACPVPVEVDCIWMSPPFKNDQFRVDIQRLHNIDLRSLLVIGTDDRQYNPDYVAAAQAAIHGQSIEVEGANHDLEITDHVMQSLHALMRIMHAVFNHLSGL